MNKPIQVFHLPQFTISPVLDPQCMALSALIVVNPFYRYAKSSRAYSQPISPHQSFHFEARHTDSLELIGQIRGYFPTHQDALWLQTLWIAPLYLRQGYGRLMFHETMVFLSTSSPPRPFKQIFLSCYEQNLVGLAFWHSLGFRTVRSTTGILVDPVDSSLKVRLLSRSYP